MEEEVVRIQTFRYGCYPFAIDAVSAGKHEMRFWIGLFFSNGEFHRRAFEEVLVVAVVSIFPLLILPFIASAKSAAETPFLLTATIWSAISSGQLYIYSFSLFGTIIWLCVEDVSQKTFAPRKYFVIAAILSAFLCLLV